MAFGLNWLVTGRLKKESSRRNKSCYEKRPNYKNQFWEKSRKIRINEFIIIGKSRVS